MDETSLSRGVSAIFQPGDLLLTVKGAPEMMLDRCTHYTGTSGANMVLNAAAREKIDMIKNEWSSQGRRVLLLAHKAISKSSIETSSLSSSTAFENEMVEHARTGLTMVGMVAIADPPRSEIPEVISTLRGAGIRIFMVYTCATPTPFSHSA